MAGIATLTLPEELYSDLTALANDAKEDPVTLISGWVHQEQNRQKWLRNWEKLGKLVRDEKKGAKRNDTETSDTENGMGAMLDIDSLVEKIRQQRMEIFDAQYAHLYR